MKTVQAILLGFALSFVGSVSGSNVVVLKSENFARHIQDHKQTLVEFYAPWCGHCKKLEPEYDKAADSLFSKNVFLGKVDATEEKDLASKYNVKGFPTLIWFEEGKETEYDGGRTADDIVDWVTSMTGAAVHDGAPPVEFPGGMKPRVVLHAASILPGFEEAAKSMRRKASWYFVRSESGQKVQVLHKSEAAVEMTDGCGDKDKVGKFVQEHLMPIFGKLDADTFDKYMEAGKGLVWSMFPMEGSVEATDAKYRPMMTDVANRFKGKYHVTMTDTEKFKEALENMLNVHTYPAIAVQKKAGDKKKYVYEGEMTASGITRFIEDVDAGRIKPKLKSEAVPEPTDDAVQTFVGSTLEQDLFRPDKDVLLEVVAPWCGHCKKLDPEYQKLAKKIKKEELSDLLVIAKIDGTANDSPIESVDWTGFPTIYFAKAGTTEAHVYDGERTAKGLWKYIKKHATKAQEIRERIEKRKGQHKKGDEL